MKRKQDMQGKGEFTRNEIEQIKDLIRKKVLAPRDEQKKIRGKMRRKYEFYISDFSDNPDGFAVKDLEMLILAGAIVIKEENSE